MLETCDFLHFKTKKSTQEQAQDREIYHQKNLNSSSKKSSSTSDSLSGKRMKILQFPGEKPRPDFHGSGKVLTNLKKDSPPGFYPSK